MGCDNRHDFRAESYFARQEMLSDIAKDRVEIIGDPLHPQGMHVQIRVSAGDVHITIDGCNVFSLYGAGLVELGVITKP